MNRISSSLIFNDESCLSVLMVRGGKVLVFDNGVHCGAKNLFKKLYYVAGISKSLQVSIEINRADKSAL